MCTYKCYGDGDDKKFGPPSSCHLHGESSTAATANPAHLAGVKPLTKPWFWGCLIPSNIVT